MLSKIFSGANLGLDAVLVTIEVDIVNQGLPSFTIVGLGDRAVDESKDRVRSAIRNSGSEFPLHKITVNLAPADLPKEGPVFDLAIALGLLKASEQIINENACFDLEKTLVVGELSLDGALRYTNGVLPIALLAKNAGFKSIIVPFDNAKEAAVIQDLEVFAFNSLSQIVKVLLGQEKIEPFKHEILNSDEELFFDYDFSQVKGQEQAKRALEIASAGGHNILMTRP